MNYIQRLFLDAERTAEKVDDLSEIFRLLDEESPEFRSIAYESASMAIAIKDLYAKQALGSWIQFRHACLKKHTFHIDIGLGWAFAKTNIIPVDFLQVVNPAVKWMAFDGIGYYNGLFKGRATIKNKIIPEEIGKANLDGFDQGLGRRLWYMAKGEINELMNLLRGFSEARQSNLWRGVGIACGYVGGTTDDDLLQLLNASAANANQLQSGILLAAISRIYSNSVNEEVTRACRIVCDKKIDSLNVKDIVGTANFFYLYKDDDKGNWLSAQVQTATKGAHDFHLRITSKLSQ